MRRPNFLPGHDSLYGPCYISQAASARWVFDLAGATTGLDFLRNHRLHCGMTFGLDLGSNARNSVVEAITDRTLVVPLLETNRNS